VSPGSDLKAFFAAQARFYADAHDPAAAARDLARALPDLDAPPGRVALYAEFVFAHVRVVLEKLYPAVRAALPAATWDAVVTRYYAQRPARVHYEVNHAGEAFPALLEQADVPGFVPALARLEWTIFAVHRSATEVPVAVDRLTLNPTVETAEHAWGLCAFADPASPRTAPPAPGDEVAIIWRHPVTRLARFMPANARTLLAVKIASEGLDPREAAEAGGVPLERVEQAIAEHVAHGLLLAPAR
jgi:hypothetical protein